MKCDYCKKEIKPKNKNGIVGSGFYDKDTKQNVCWRCREQHYLVKSKTEYANLYTEFPIIIKKTPQVDETCGEDT